MSLIEKAHSDLSASASERWLNCPPSVQLSKQAPPQGTSKWAGEGTLAHHYLEEWLLAIWYGEKYKIPRALKENEDMLSAVRSAVNYIKGIWDEDREKLFIEERVTLDFIDKEMFGTGDVFIVRPKEHLHAIDYKHGAGKVVDVVKSGTFSTEYNTQLMFYAIGMAHRYDYNFKKYTITVIQPRAQSGNGIKSVSFTNRQLKDYIAMFKRGVKRVREGKGKTAQGQWCYWCPAREHNCPLHERIKYEKSKELLEGFD